MCVCVDFVGIVLWIIIKQTSIDGIISILKVGCTGSFRFSVSRTEGIELRLKSIVDFSSDHSSELGHSRFDSTGNSGCELVFEFVLYLISKFFEVSFYRVD